jgi:hypothetical protein
MADKALARKTPTFHSPSRARLIGAMLIVAVAVACLAVAVVSPPPGTAFRIIWALAWLSFALFGIRLARLATQVRGDRLVIRGFFRTRKFHASQISRIALVRIRNGQYRVYTWIPRAYLHKGGSVRLWGLGATGSGQEPATLTAAVNDISALLGVHT